MFKEKVIRNPNDDFFVEFLRPYYVVTRDGQYLFASKQTGRRPDRVFYMVPKGYKLGAGQQEFDAEIGRRIYEVAFDYLRDAKVILQDGSLGESDYRVGLKVTTSIENPHGAYIAWIGKMMMFPRFGEKTNCWNYIIPEQLPSSYVERIKDVWPEYDAKEPITLYDFTEMDEDVRRALSINVDYFGGAYKKPNLTMVWNKAESEGLISYHAGCTTDRILKGLSGTGKTTLTVGPELEQDDACLGKPIYNNGKIETLQIIGLEAASFAKSEGLNDNSPEWPGLMKSKQGHIVLGQNIDCEGVEYVYKDINGYTVRIPMARDEVGSLMCTSYEKSGTTNGRFIFRFSDLNENWNAGKKYLEFEGLSFKRYDILEPLIRITDPKMATALDSACETIITSAIAGRKPGERVRRYAATEFMAREQAQQALMKLKMYTDLGLDDDGKLVFHVINSGYVGEHDINGNRIGGEKISVEDSKKLISLLEFGKIRWLRNPIFGYLVPDPKYVEGQGIKDFSRRFNLLRYYTAEEIIEIARRDIRERTEFLQNLFKGQENTEELEDVIHVWEDIKMPTPQEVQEFYERHYQ